MLARMASTGLLEPLGAGTASGVTDGVAGLSEVFVVSLVVASLVSAAAGILSVVGDEFSVTGDGVSVGAGVGVGVGVIFSTAGIEISVSFATSFTLSDASAVGGI